MDELTKKDEYETECHEKPFDRLGVTKLTKFSKLIEVEGIAMTDKDSRPELLEMKKKNKGRAI